MKKESGEEKSTPRMMTVYYERLSSKEEDALMEAVEAVICPENSDDGEHDCRLHCMIFNDLVEEE